MSPAASTPLANAVTGTACLNCGESFGERGELRRRFCPECGQETTLRAPLWLKLAYRNRRLRYTEHLVFSLHVHAFWFVALLFALPDWGLLTALVLLAMPVYTLMAMKRVYGGGLWPRLLRACLVSALYGTTLVLALAGVALVTLV